MRVLVVVLALGLLAAPLALAAPTAGKEKGLARACERATSSRPCEHLGLIPDTTVGPGQSKTYQGSTFTAQGTIRVQAGGSVTVQDATMQFASTSNGILVETGGTLRIVRSVLEPRPSEATTYRLDLAPGSTFVLNLSTVRGGTGVKLATSDADVAGNSFESIPLALHLLDVVVTIHHNQFLSNTVAVNQTGGVTTLDQNLFSGGQTCVEDWLSDPTITNNVFRGCHTGILHKRSHSIIRGNNMEDEIIPPGAGIVVQDTDSPVIEDNVISNYYTGILVVNATAYIRNNSITSNAADGIRVVANTGPMDIQGNLIASNGGDGIDLQDVAGVSVFDNEISANAAYGLVALGATGLEITGNAAFANGVDGIAVVGAPGVVIEGNTVVDNEATGIVVGHSSPDATLRENDALANGQHGIFVRSSGATLEGNEANENGLSGFAVEGASGVVFQGDSSKGNFLYGFRFAAASVDASDVLARFNGAGGLQANGTGSYVLVRPNASDNAGDGFQFADAAGTLVEARAMSNAGDGLRVSGPPATADGGWWEGNAGAGVRAVGTSVSATCSYWGSASGPTAPDNPSGTGDEAVGDVDWSPFRSSPAATCPPGPLT